VADIQLGYGRGRLDLAAEPGRFEILSPAGAEGTELTDAGIAGRIDSPIGSPPLATLVSPGDKVCLVVPDATRASGSHRIVPLLVDRLLALGVEAAGIEILVGAGTHREPTAGEIETIVGAATARRVRVAHHDAHDPSAHENIGTTARGTPVDVNRRLLEADRVVLTGAIGLHYFAGFSGGRKAFLPGCASEPAIQTNHLLGFDRETLTKAEGVESGRLDGNPVSEDMENAARIFGPTYLVNGVLDGNNRIVGLYAGDWFAAHRLGCSEYLAAHSIEAGGRRPVVVASCGGAPRDINMIQSHKALEHARVVLEDGGDLILVAECSEGLGRADFLDWFVPGGSRATALKLLQHYKINGQTAWGIRWKSERYRVHLISSLDPADVRRMGMIPHAGLDEALAASNGGRGYVLPNALGTLPVLRRGGAGMPGTGG